MDNFSYVVVFAQLFLTKHLVIFLSFVPWGGGGVGPLAGTPSSPGGGGSGWVGAPPEAGFSSDGDGRLSLWVLCVCRNSGPDVMCAKTLMLRGPR